MIELRRDEMTTKLKNKEQTSNPMVAIAADPTKTTFSFRDVIEEGSPIDTWAESVCREKRVVSKEDVIAHLEDLEFRRKSIDEGILRRAHHALYLLLADCLALATLAADSDPDSVRNGAVDDFLKSRSIGIDSAEPLFARVVAAVFGKVHPTRVSSYRAVLLAASAEEITPAELPAWIEKQGGIQAIRVSKGRSSSQEQYEMMKLTRSYLLERGNVATLRCDELSKQTSIESNNREVVLVATKKPDGTFLVHAVVEEAAAVDKAMAAYRDKNLDAIKEFKIELKYRPGLRAA
jgi:hypothetical protein